MDALLHHASAGEKDFHFDWFRADMVDESTSYSHSLILLRYASSGPFQRGQRTRTSLELPLQALRGTIGPGVAA